MAILNTPRGLPYPDNDEALKDVPDFISALALELDDRIMTVYSTQSALASAGPFSAGQLAWITADSVLQIYSGSAWVTIYPASPRIFSGTSVPSSGLGSNGDIYVRY